MTIRVDSAQLISDRVVVGGYGLGVLAEDVPSSGDAGAGYMYNDLSFPADNGKEVYGKITRFPTLGTLAANEDSSFTYDGDTDYFEYELYVDGVLVGGTTRVDLIVGGTVVQAIPTSISVSPSVGTVTTDINVFGISSAIDVSTSVGSVTIGQVIEGIPTSISVSPSVGTVTYTSATVVDAIAANISVSAARGTVTDAVIDIPAIVERTFVVETQSRTFTVKASPRVFVYEQ